MSDRHLVVQPQQIHADRVTFLPEQIHYLRRVLRLQGGEMLVVLNGQGRAWQVQLVAEGDGWHGQMLAEVRLMTELAIAPTLLIALPKGNLMDDIVRQATEIGVGAIVPVITERTLLQPSAQKIERWQRIAAEATEQSERQIVPVIYPPMGWAQAVTEIPHSPGLMAVTRRSAPHLLDWLQSHDGLANDAKVAIGPEGGWTETEVAQAIVAGWQPVSLGPRILRTATAPLVALSLIAAVIETRYTDNR